MNTEKIQDTVSSEIDNSYFKENEMNTDKIQDTVSSEKSNLKAKAKAKFEEVKVWVEDNKERKRRVAKKANHNDKGRYVYDARLGNWWQLKRKPSNSDWAKIVDDCYRGDSSLESILRSMDLIH